MIKPAQMKLSLAFVSSQALYVNLSVLFGVVCLTLERKIVMASQQQQAFKMCVGPCLCYLMGGDTHILCVACLGEESVSS